MRLAKVSNLRFSKPAAKEAGLMLLMVVGGVLSLCLLGALIGGVFWVLALIGEWAVITGMVIGALAIAFLILYFAADERQRLSDKIDNGETVETHD